MKLMVIGPDIRDRRKVKNFTGVQAFYLMRELRARGVDLHFIDGKHKDPLNYLRDVDPAGADHVLALGLRWFTHQPVGCASIIGTKVRGKVTQMHDGLVHDWLSEHMIGVDCNFMFRDDALRTKSWERYADRNHYIGWAADAELLYPEQKQGELRILIDHPYYKSGQPDVTEGVTLDAAMFAQCGGWQERYRSIRLRRLVNGGAEDIDINNVQFKSFDRQHIPFEDIATEYRKTTVYMATHKESVGLTCLELAYCGALITSPCGLIYQDRLDTVRHVQYEGTRAPWSVILSQIDIEKSKALARKQTWDKVADRLLGWFAEHDAGK
jgi:hypothetical protein